LNPDKPKLTEQISIRVSPEFRARIQAEAIIQSRSEANMIKAIIEEYFFHADRAKSLAEKK
jgi:predicted DNA-binding protein